MLPTTAHPARRIAPPAPAPNRRPLSDLQAIARLRSNPLTLWTERHFREPIVSGSGMRGHATVLSDPAAIRHVLVDNVANYGKDALQRRVLSPGLGDGLLTAEGEGWRRVRRTVAPLFTPRRVGAMALAMQGAAERLVARWRRRPEGATLDISEEMTRTTFDVLSATLFSRGIGADADAFSRAMGRYFDTQGRIDPLDLFDMPAWLPRVGRIMATPAIRFFEERVRAIIGARQALIAAGEELPADLLTALLRAADPETGIGLTEQEVGANIVTFIGAGHETTANTLTWAIYLLSGAPDILERLEAEAEAVAARPPGDWLDAAPLARAVLEEAMRLYPPVAFLSRTAAAADMANGHAIPKGSAVIIAPWVLHRHKTLWTAPDLFVPERFLPGARENIDRFAYLPFGAGPRICIGLGFALQEAAIVLLTIVRAARLSYAGESAPKPVQRITLRPAGGMPMRLERR